MRKFLEQLPIPPILKNFYVLSGILFLGWILIFDRNDLITHFQLRKELNQVESQKAYFADKIQVVETNRTELEDDKELLEKFAREKYLMKKDNEDLYVIEFQEEN